MDTPPAPPPEGVLIRLAREAADLRVADVAREAGISIARWSQIENGRETRGGTVKKVRAKSGTIARMAAAVGIPADRLETEGERPDAALIMREIQRLNLSAGAPPPEEGADSDASLAATILDLADDFERVNGRPATGDDLFPGPALRAQWERNVWADTELADAARAQIIASARRLRRQGKQERNDQTALCRT